MKTRIVDLPGGRFGFEYTEARHPLPHQWRALGVTAAGAIVPSHLPAEAVDRAIWSSAWRRDQARACFTRRRTVDAALADLQKLGPVFTPTT